MNENTMTTDLMTTDLMNTDLTNTDLMTTDLAAPVWHFDGRSAIIGGLATLAVVTTLGVIRHKKAEKKQATIEQMAKQKVAEANQQTEFTEVNTDEEPEKAAK